MTTWKFTHLTVLSLLILVEEMLKYCRRVEPLPVGTGSSKQRQGRSIYWTDKYNFGHKLHKVWPLCTCAVQKKSRELFWPWNEYLSNNVLKIKQILPDRFFWNMRQNSFNTGWNQTYKLCQYHTEPKPTNWVQIFSNVIGVIWQMLMKSLHGSN